MCGIFHTFELYTNYKRTIRTCVEYSKLLNCKLTNYKRTIRTCVGYSKLLKCILTNYKRTIRTCVGYSKLLNCILTINGLYVHVWDIQNY